MNHSPFKITINLKQHTHLIHFQHDQKGATLRASEVKPKLDKFLIEHCFGSDFQRYKHLLIGYDEQKDREIGDQYFQSFGGKLAFNYKLNFYSSNNNKATPIKKEFPLYFGNQGKGPKKSLVLDEQEISMEIFSFSKEILAEFNTPQLLSSFFALHNFGTRQSKGFGSFFPVEEQYKFDEKLFDYRVFLNFDNNKETNHKKTYRAIDLFYKSIRAGINIPDKIYFKSLLFLYFSRQNIKWEKKKIKEVFLEKNIGKNSNGTSPWALENQQAKHFNLKPSPVHYNSDNEKLVKDLLGLSSTETWQSYQNNTDKDLTISKTQAKQLPNGTHKKMKKPEIERYPSPIFIKIIRDLSKSNFFKIYFKLNNTNPLAGKYFTIESNLENREAFELQIPVDFSLSEYFNFFTNPQNFSCHNHVDQRFHKEKIYGSLSNFFSLIKKINK